MSYKRILCVKPYQLPWENEWHEDSRMWFVQRWGKPHVDDAPAPDTERWRHVVLRRTGVGSLEEAQAIVGDDAPVYEVDMSRVDYIGKHRHCKGLVIGNGATGIVAGSIPADVKICANGGYPYFTELAQKQPNWYWFAPEQDSFRFDWYYQVPKCFKRILNPHKRLFPLEIYEPGIDHYFTLRSWADPFNPREIEHGLQDHPEGMNASGTFTLNAMHMLAVMGCSEIHIVGCEMGWNDGEPLHFYEDAPSDDKVQRIAFAKAAKIIRSQLPAFENAGVRLVWHCDSNVFNDKLLAEVSLDS